MNFKQLCKQTQAMALANLIDYKIEDYFLIDQIIENLQIIQSTISCKAHNKAMQASSKIYI